MPELSNRLDGIVETVVVTVNEKIHLFHGSLRQLRRKHAVEGRFGFTLWRIFIITQQSRGVGRCPRIHMSFYERTGCLRKSTQLRCLSDAESQVDEPQLGTA